MTAQSPSGGAGFDPAEWTLADGVAPRGWFREQRLDDPLDVRLDGLLARVLAVRPSELASFDLVVGQDSEARMLQVYAVRAGARAVRHGDRDLVDRACAALAVAVPVADYRDQLRSIAVVADAARRLGLGWSGIVDRMGARWSRERLRRFRERGAPGWGAVVGGDGVPGRGDRRVVPLRGLAGEC